MPSDSSSRSQRSQTTSRDRPGAREKDIRTREMPPANLRKPSGREQEPPRAGRGVPRSGEFHCRDGKLTGGSAEALRHDRDAGADRQLVGGSAEALRHDRDAGADRQLVPGMVGGAVLRHSAAVAPVRLASVQRTAGPTNPEAFSFAHRSRVHLARAASPSAPMRMGRARPRSSPDARGAHGIPARGLSAPIGA